MEKRGFNKAIFIWIVTAASVLLSSCAPVAVEKNTADTEIKFEPSLEDRELPWDKIQSTNTQWFLPKSTSFVLSGSRLMNMFENLMFLGDSLNDVGIRHRAHDFVRSFYGSSDNTTSPKIEQSLYLEAALGEKKAVLLNLLKNKQKGLQDTVPALDRTLPKVKSALGNVNRLPLSDLAPAIQAMLDNFVAILEAEGGLRMVWKELKAQVDGTYREQISELGRALVQVSPAKRVVDNTRLMRTVLKLPLSGPTLKNMEAQFNKIDDVASRLERLDGSYDGMRLLLDIWLMLDDKARQSTFKKFSSVLYYALTSKGDDWVRSLRENNSYDPLSWSLEQITIRNGLAGIIKVMGVEKLKNDIAPELQKAVPAKFEEQMKAEILKLPDLVAKLVKEKIDANDIKIKKALSTKENTREFFANLSVTWGKREIYQGKDYAQGLERDRYVVKMEEDGAPNFSPDPNVSLNSTTSNVLGASFSLAARRFDRVTEFEGTTYEHPAYFQMVMSMLNKIPALGGFTKIDDTLYPSFHILKNGRDVFERQLDIKTQSGSDFYYVVPDYIALKPPFRMDNDRTQTMGLQFGVASQAELLRGLSHAVEFLRDWKVNGFDVKMGRYILGDLIPDLPPHLHNEALFPKDKLFEYALGIASVILENMKREGSGLVLMDEGGKIFYGNEIDKAKKAQALMAAMVDIKLSEREDTIRTADLSRYILAMSKFVSAIQGFESSRSQVLHKIEDGEEKMAKKLRESLSQVKLLMAMMSNFLVHKMQRADGSMDSFYSLKVGKVISNSRNLEDQLLAIQALLTTGETLGMGVYLGSAYDIYFGMNHVFFNDSKGFYSTSDRTWRAPDSYLYTELLTALTRLSKKTDFSRGQINRLIGQFRGQLTH